jgi:hypothetical protein
MNTFVHPSGVAAGEQPEQLDGAAQREVGELWEHKESPQWDGGGAPYQAGALRTGSSTAMYEFAHPTGQGGSSCLMSAGDLNGYQRSYQRLPSPGTQGESRMLDSQEDVHAGQARFEYPPTFVLFSMCSHLASCANSLSNALHER